MVILFVLSGETVVSEKAEFSLTGEILTVSHNEDTVNAKVHTSMRGTLQETKKNVKGNLFV